MEDRQKGILFVTGHGGDDSTGVGVNHFTKLRVGIDICLVLIFAWYFIIVYGNGIDILLLAILLFALVLIFAGIFYYWLWEWY